MDLNRLHRTALTVADEAAQYAGTSGHVASACEGWSVADVVRHLIAVQSMEILGQPVSTKPGDEGLADLSPDEVLPAWQALVERLRAIKVDTAPPMLPSLDLLMHAWDIRQGLHRAGLAEPLEFSDDILEVLEDYRARAPEDKIRTPEIFGPEQHAPDDATRTQRFMAWTGRHVA